MNQEEHEAKLEANREAPIYKSYKKYHHIERLGNIAVEGILDGEVTVQTKVDGANLSVFWDEEDGLMIASRNHLIYRQNQTGVINAFNGAVDYVLNHPGIINVVKEGYILRGEWLCLSGDTLIRKTSGGQLKGRNYMTLKEMYDFLNRKDGRRNESWWQRYGMPSVYSLFSENDKILPNKIKTIIYTGQKQSYKITTRKGFSIKSSRDHRFLTNLGWTPLSKLSVNDVIAVTEFGFSRQNRHLGKGTNKVLISQREFKKEKGRCVQCGNTTSLELDHIDGNYKNNDKSNWQVLCRDCHHKKSRNNTKKAHTNGYNYEFDKIVSIDYVGVEDMYDIEMEGNETNANFVANNFVVHNCKHSVQYGNEFWRKFYVFDVESALGTLLNFHDCISLLESAKILYIKPLAVLNSPQVSDLVILTQGPDEFGANQKEGIVIKSYNFVNKFGRTQFAKLIAEDFREKNKLAFGASSQDPAELRFATKFVSREFVKKTIFTVADNRHEEPTIRHMGEILGRVYHDLFTEELWDFIKAEKVGAFNFKDLNRLCLLRTKSIALDFYNGVTNVHDNNNVSETKVESVANE